MKNLMNKFNELAAVVVGGAATVVSAQSLVPAVDLLFTAGGVPPGLITGLFGLAVVGAGALAGGAIGYRGTMEVGQAVRGIEPALRETTGPAAQWVSGIGRRCRPSNRLDWHRLG